MMTNQTTTIRTILIIDSDPRYQLLLKTALSASGYQVVVAHNGETAWAYFSQYDPDLVLLEVQIDRMCGFSICEKIRSCSHRPIIFLSNKSDEAYRVKGLGLGADDYITKPCSLRELLARIEAILRRVNNTWREVKPRKIFQHGDLRIDFNQAEVWIGDQPANLSTTEYRLLIHFAQNVGQLISGEQLLRDIWGEQYQNDRDVLWVSLARLRSKVEKDIKNPVHIITQSRKGYMMPDTKEIQAGFPI